MDETVYPDAIVRSLVANADRGLPFTTIYRRERRMARGQLRVLSTKWRKPHYPIIRTTELMLEVTRELNIHAMRMGPGKHLIGRTLMNGLVKPEEFDYFHEVCPICVQSSHKV